MYIYIYIICTICSRGKLRTGCKGSTQLHPPVAAHLQADRSGPLVTGDTTRFVGVASLHQSPAEVNTFLSFRSLPLAVGRVKDCARPFFFFTTDLFFCLPILKECPYAFMSFDQSKRSLSTCLCDSQPKVGSSFFDLYIHDK